MNTAVQTPSTINTINDQEPTMNTATRIPFTTVNANEEEDTMTVYTTRHDLEDALDMYNTTAGVALSEESLESLADYLSARADYVDGVWDTGALLNIDTIDEDTFTQLVIAADNGEL
jgi:hypothetical protein